MDCYKIAKYWLDFPLRKYFSSDKTEKVLGLRFCPSCLPPRGNQWLLSSGKREFGSTAIQGQFWIIAISNSRSFPELCKAWTRISEPEKLKPAANTGHLCFTFFYFHVKYHWCILQRDLNLVVWSYNRQRPWQISSFIRPGFLLGSQESVAGRKWENEVRIGHGESLMQSAWGWAARSR